MKKNLWSIVFLMSMLFFITGTINHLSLRGSFNPKAFPLPQEHHGDATQQQLDASLADRQQRIDQVVTIQEAQEEEKIITEIETEQGHDHDGIETDLVTEPVTTPAKKTTSEKTTVATAKKEPVKKVCPKPDPDTVPLVDYLFPVSSNTSIETFVPDNLEDISLDIPTSGSSTCVTSETRTALISLFAAMEAEKLSPVFVSGYRSETTQKKLYEKQVELLGKNQNTVAKPKHSEHQLGTTFDMKAKQGKDAGYVSFGNTLEYQWMVAHAHEYGFVQSYQLGKESINNYRNEPWHWRYVGVKHATVLKTLQISLLEYLTDLNAKNPLVTAAN